MRLPRVLTGIALLIGANSGLFAYTVYLLGNVSLIPGMSWLSKNVGSNIVYLVLIAVDVLSIYLLMRSSGSMSVPSLSDFRNGGRRGFLVPLQQVEEPIVEEKPVERIQPEMVKDTTLENLMGSAMKRGLNADLKFTLKLPENTKLDILGQKWDVSDAEIKLNNVKEVAAIVPTDGLSEEERRYYQGA